MQAVRCPRRHQAAPTIFLMATSSYVSMCLASTTLPKLPEATRGGRSRRRMSENRGAASSAALLSSHAVAACRTRGPSSSSQVHRPAFTVQGHWGGHNMSTRTCGSSISVRARTCARSTRMHPISRAGRPWPGHTVCPSAALALTPADLADKEVPSGVSCGCCARRHLARESLVPRSGVYEAHGGYKTLECID